MSKNLINECEGFQLSEAQERDLRKIVQTYFPGKELAELLRKYCSNERVAELSESLSRKCVGVLTSSPDFRDAYMPLPDDLGITLSKKELKEMDATAREDVVGDWVQEKGRTYIKDLTDNLGYPHQIMSYAALRRVTEATFNLWKTDV